MNYFFCALALLSPKRPPEMVGKTVTKLEVYRTDKTEHCFEEVKKLGATWVDDEVLWFREVERERCWGLF